MKGMGVTLWTPSDLMPATGDGQGWGRWTKGGRFEYDPWWTDNVFSIAGIFYG